MTIEERIAKLREWDQFYFGADTPLVSDAEYDAFREATRKLASEHPYFTKIGAPVQATAWQKVKHAAPMTSLNKLWNPAELKDWLDGLHPGDLLVTTKLDGIACSLRYENGNLVRALTRGDGEVGEDITKNVRAMSGARARLTTPFTGHVRGEIVLRHSQFEQHFRPLGYKNCRNAAGGAAKDLTGVHAHLLDVICYEWLPDIVPFLTKSDEFDALQAAGLQVPDFIVTGRGVAGVLEVYDAYVRELRATLDYDIDGLVIAVDDNLQREMLGDLGGCPAGARALKFPAAAAETVLRDVVWQVGASGRITPVAVFDPVELAGATVRRASLHNVANIQALARRGAERDHLVIGDVVRTVRCGDVIPGVEAIVCAGTGVPLLVPRHCPVCKTATVMQGEYLVCPNKASCEAQSSGAVKRWVDKIGVKDVGGAIIDTLVADGLVKTPADLYRLRVADVANLQLSGRRVGESTAETAIGNLLARMNLPLHVLLGALGIPLWGRSMCRLLSRAGFNTLGKFADATVEQLVAIDGVGQVKAEAFVAGFEAVRDVVDGLLQAGVQILPEPDGPLQGKTVCLTGFRDAALDAAVEEAGGTMKSGVSKALDYLVAKDPRGTGGKLDLARKYGVAIVGIEDFKKILIEGGE